MAWSGEASTPWDALAAANPLSALADPSALWGLPAPGGGAMPWPVDPVTATIAGLETWRWVVNLQVDLALAGLNALRAMSR